MATSSFSRPSSCSSRVERVREGWARIMSIDMIRRSSPPAVLKAPSEMPKARKMSPPARENRVRVANATSAARRAIPRRLSIGSRAVIDTKMGTAASGSTTKKTAVKARMAKRTLSGTRHRDDGRG